MKSYRFTPFLPALLLLLSILFACSHKQDNLAPYGWKSAGQIFDTLTMRAERIFAKSRDTLRAARIIQAMQAESDAHPDRPLLHWRALYWQGRLAMRKGDYDSAFSLMNKALQLVDTNHYAYDRDRILWNMDIEFHPATVARYHELSGLIDRMKQAGDIPLWADYTMQLGCFLNDIGDYEHGMPLLDRADSLFALAGLPEQAINNRINRANALNNQGNSRQGARILRKILADSSFRPAPDALDLIMGNIYEMTADTAMLRRAWLNTFTQPGLDQSRTIYADYWADEKMKIGQWDSAAYYHNIAEAGQSELDIPVSIMDHYRVKYLLLRHAGRPDSALYYLEKTSNLADSIHSAEARTEIANAALNSQLAGIRLNAEINQRHEQLWLSLIIFLIIAAAGIGAWFAYRRMQRARLKEATDALELERSKRKMAALRIILQENSSLIDDVDSHIAELSSRSRIAPSDLSELRSSLRSHNISDEQRRDFLDTFGEINPDFTEKLRQAFPSLTDSDLRLCVYIALGLDSKHIARIAHIRPESVKQARWRLRTKMNLPQGQSLDTVMRRFLAD